MSNTTDDNAASAMAALLRKHIQSLGYMVNNPSAWEDGFNQAASDVLEKAVEEMKAVLAKATP